MKKIISLLIGVILIMPIHAQEMNKLRKIKEFNSYEEYEKYIGKIKETKKIKIDGRVVSFFNDKGALIKQKTINVYDEQKAKKIRANLKDDSAGIQTEFAKIMPNERGVLIIKGTDYGIKGGEASEYEILDKEGNQRGQIKDSCRLYPSPNGKYFLGLDEGVGVLVNILKVFNEIGETIYNKKFMESYARGHKIIFSENSRYALIAIRGNSNNGDGIVLYDSEQNSIWKVFNKEWRISYGGISFLYLNEGVLLSTSKGMYRFSMQGDQIWHNEQVRDRYEEKEKRGAISQISISPNEKDIVGYAWPGTVYILDIKEGGLIKEVILPESIRYKYSSGPILTNRNKYFLIKKSGSVSPPHISEDQKNRTIYLISKKGEFLWKNEKVDMSVDVELNDNEEVLLKTENKVNLYKVVEVK